MSKVFSPWADSDPYRRGHVIRAEEVNVKFEGITTAFDELAKLINQRVMLLPGSFDGSNVVDVGLVANTLLHINAEGNLSAYSLTAFENNVALAADYKEAAYASANSAGISLQQVQQLHDQVVLLESNVTSLSQQTTVAKDTAVNKAGEAAASAASANDDKIAAANSASSANDDKIAAAGSASTAASHESNAKTYRDEALSYRNTASSHKDAAAGSVSSASASAGSAFNSASTATAQATLAEKWAQHPENTAVENGKYSAYHWAKKAQEYAGAVDYNWSAIQGRPNTFPPSGHGHSWPEISGKPVTATRWPTKNEVGLGNVPNVNLEPIFYYNSNDQTLSGDGGKTRIVCLNWSRSPTFTINGGSFGVGSEIKIVNQRGGGTITLTGDVMYTPDGSSSSTHTFSKPGTVHLINYSSDRWMLQVY